jgi:hypothetical protein
MIYEIRPVGADEEFEQAAAVASSKDLDFISELGY